MVKQIPPPPSHLVWTRDMVNSATGLLAAGHQETAFRALIYLAISQQPDGGFPQNFWINGEAYWRGIQLDEVAFPILLAWRLRRENALQDFDPYPMVMPGGGLPYPQWSCYAAGAVGGGRRVLAFHSSCQHCRADMRRRVCA